jgi:hypothetical protein
MKQLLTDSALRGLKPGETPFKMTDGGGLYVLVMPNGARYWRYNYVLGGKAKTLALGQYPTIKLKEAPRRRKSKRESTRCRPGRPRRPKGRIARRSGMRRKAGIS